MEYFRQRFIDELNQEGDIEIRGVTWSRDNVLKTMDKETYDEVFREWTDQAKEDAKQRVLDFLTANNCLERFRLLNHRYQQSQIVPFVGAGLSIQSGFQTWGNFIRSLVTDCNIDEQRTIIGMMACGEYEEAAQRARDNLGEGVFDGELRERLGSHKLQAIGNVNLLPVLFLGEVVTTNFDYVLINSYRDHGAAFSNVMRGVELRGAVARLGSDNHALLRLHGEADTSLGRVLTLAEYETVYTEERSLKGMLAGIVGTRSFLFLGCSLDTDRTLNAFTDIKAEAGIDLPPHFAFVSQPEQDKVLDRRQFLERSGIFPIFYPADDHDQAIEDLLVTMMEGGV